MSPNRITVWSVIFVTVWTAAAALFAFIIFRMIAPIF